MVRMGLKLYPMHTAGRESAGHKIGWQGKLLPGWLEVPAGWVASWRLAGAPRRPHRWVWVSARKRHRVARVKADVAACCGRSPSSEGTGGTSREAAPVTAAVKPTRSVR